MIYILAGNIMEYTEARLKLNLSPNKAFWLTRPSNLDGLYRPQVYRYGAWEEIPRIDEIVERLDEIKAIVEDIA
jgi:hypothetical protein